ncbi:MAG: hypothetical protein AAF389_01640 [Gemmatimonadota bacterium]
MANSTARPSELWVILMVLAGLAVTEGALTVLRPQLSGDIRHLDEADDIVREVVQGEGLRVVVGGNSLIGEGIDGALLEQSLEEATGEEVTLGVIRPDGTGPLEWDYLYRRIMFNVEELPDVLVLGFGPGHMRDRRIRTQLLRLAVHHVDRSDLRRFFTFDGLDFEERATAVLASSSVTFGLRDRISARVLATLIPGYRQRALLLLSAAPSPSNPQNVGSYRHLEALLDEAAQYGVPVVMMAMPAQTPYDVEAPVVALSGRRGVELVDVNPIPALLGPSRYFDDQHLDAEGRQLFTTSVAPFLAEGISRAIEGR